MLETSLVLAVSPPILSVGVAECATVTGRW